MIRYIICPGLTPSAHDPDFHWVGAEQLIRLYRLDPRECLVYRRDEPGPSARSIGVAHPDAIWLGPEYSGDYEIKRPK